jgi:hypothetical protein
MIRHDPGHYLVRRHQGPGATARWDSRGQGHGRRRSVCVCGRAGRPER